MTINTRIVWSKQLKTHKPSLSGDQSKDTIGCVEITLELSSSTFPLVRSLQITKKVLLLIKKYTYYIFMRQYLWRPSVDCPAPLLYENSDNDTCTCWNRHFHHLESKYVYVYVDMLSWRSYKYHIEKSIAAPVMKRSLFCGRCLIHHTVALWAFSLKHENPAGKKKCTHVGLYYYRYLRGCMLV